MAHLAAILFFAALLLGLAVLLEQIVKANWAEIVAALRQVPPERFAAPAAPGPVVVKRPRPHAAA